MRKHPQQSKLDQLAAHDLRALFHLTDIKNLPRILRLGILPKAKLIQRGVVHVDISEPTVQNRRDAKTLTIRPGVERSVHEMVPLFLRTRTPMLFRRKEMAPDLCFIVVDARLISEDDVECVVCDGNAASNATQFFLFDEDGSALDELPWSVLDAEWWNDIVDGRRKRSAELLIWPSVPTEAFVGIIVKDANAGFRVQEILDEMDSDLECGVAPKYFF